MQVLEKQKKYNVLKKHKKLYKGLFLLADFAYDLVFGESERKEINRHVDIYHHQIDAYRLKKNLNILNDAEVIFAGWQCPPFTSDVLDAAKNLKAIFYAAGSIKPIVNNGELFERGIKITSSRVANGIPVAEFCLSQIIFSLKLGWHHALKVMRNKKWLVRDERFIVPGCYNSTVGLISLGAISTKLIELLKPFDINILLACDYLTEEQASKIGVRVATVEEIFRTADVISLHTAEHETKVITGEHFRLMKPNTTFLNTARGVCVKQQEMIDVLKQRKDIVALLDVTDPEPPEPNSELFDLPNIVIFPHIAGSMNDECRRMARYAIDDFHRFVKGEPMLNEVTKEQWQFFA